ncbi:MAG: SAM-dependent methyltransferase, partial [Clostridia bacterium]|nr:SAM-dependent methyltransferase [Clostridia bacterium]
RWIVDDCIKFVQREIRRGNKYDIIIMDPPSYGRGPGGEVWKLEDEVYNFVELCSELLYEDSLMMLINSYTTGLSSSVMEYILGAVVKNKFGGKVTSSEIGLPVTDTGMVLPCGASAFWQK